MHITPRYKSQDDTSVLNKAQMHIIFGLSYTYHIYSICCTHHTSAGCGNIATVMVLVCMRPCFSVFGTLWTRWTPASNFIFL